MNINIGKLVSKPRTNCYVIEVKLMHGDADGYTNHEMVFPETKLGLFESAFKTLNAMYKLPWNDAREGYKKLINFRIWFQDEYGGAFPDEEKLDEEWPDEIDEEKFEEIQKFSFLWEHDHTWDEYLARLDGFKMFYFDTNGDKYEVHID